MPTLHVSVAWMPEAFMDAHRVLSRASIHGVIRLPHQLHYDAEIILIVAKKRLCEDSS